MIAASPVAAVVGAGPAGAADSPRASIAHSTVKAKVKPTAGCIVYGNVEFCSTPRVLAIIRKALKQAPPSAIPCYYDQYGNEVCCWIDESGNLDCHTV